MKIRPLQYVACACAALCGLVSGSQVVAQTIQKGFTALPPLPAAAPSNQYPGTTTVAQPETPSRERKSIRNMWRHTNVRPSSIEASLKPKQAEAQARIITIPKPASKVVPKAAADQPLVAPRVAEIHQALPQAESLQNHTIERSVNQNSAIKDSVKTEQESGRYLVSFAQSNQAPNLEDAVALQPVDDSQTPQPDDMDESTRDADEDQEGDDASADSSMEDDDSNELDDLDLDEDKDEEGDGEEGDGEEEDDEKREPRTFGTWPKKSLQEVRIDVRDYSGTVPEDESYALGQNPTGSYFQPKTSKTFAWAAPNIRHQPLYFEDASLERYGQTKGLVKQPIVSTFKFLRDGALLPINAAIDCPKSCDTPLGFGRPGSGTGGCGCSSCQK